MGIFVLFHSRVDDTPDDGHEPEGLVQIECRDDRFEEVKKRKLDVDIAAVSKESDEFVDFSVDGTGLRVELVAKCQRANHIDSKTICTIGNVNHLFLLCGVKENLEEGVDVGLHLGFELSECTVGESWGKETAPFAMLGAIDTDDAGGIF